MLGASIVRADYKYETKESQAISAYLYLALDKRKFKYQEGKIGYMTGRGLFLHFGDYVHVGNNEHKHSVSWVLFLQ